ncbi:MAG: flagellar filament capping protein FliD [Clostridia bacterium]|nr:flagellar filament capping protein FliD [Clostridia bacterium]
MASSIYSTNRITGLSSGLDTDSLIKAALQSSQSKLDRLYQNKTSLEWKRDAYTSVRTKASDFSSKYFSALSSDNIFSKNVYKQFKVSVSDKYSSVFSIKGTSSAQAGKHTISSTKLATSASIQSGNRVTGTTKSVSNDANVNSKKQATTTNKLVDTDGNAIKGDTDLKDVKLDGSQETAFEKVGDKYLFSVRSSNAKDAKEEVIELREGSTVNDLLSELSSKGVDAKLNDDGTFTFTSKTVGKDSTVSVAGTGTNAEKAFALPKELKNVAAVSGSTTLNELKNMGKMVTGDDGNLAFKINGITFTTDPAAENSDTVVKLDNNASLDDIAKAVNESKAGVSMKIEVPADNSDLKISIIGDSGANVDVSNVSGRFFGVGENDEKSITGIRVQNAAGGLNRSDSIATALQKMGLNDSVLDSNGTLKFQIANLDGKMVPFEFSKNDTLDKMMTTINGTSDLGVKLSYSQITDKFTFESTKEGSNATVHIQNDENGGNALQFFGMSGTSASAKGTNAEIVIDGETISQESNKFTLDGLEITIKDNWTSGVTNVEGSVLGDAKIGVEQDIDSTVDKMKAFVTAYNELVDELYKMTTESKDYDYEPLTEEQRENMEDKDIEKWETEAKKGLLRNDTVLRTYLSRMRSALFEKIDGTKFSDITGATKDQGLSAYDIGFNTSSYATGEYGGKLVFDEDKFRAAMERDPDAVANVMAQISDASDKDENYKGSGFVTKLFDITSDFVNTLRGTSIANTNKQINDLNDSMDDLIEKMYQQQERLYQQYASLETLMTSYQNQSTWLSNQLAGLTTTS